MQNKANFRKAKMNENSFATKGYENETAFELCENKANFRKNECKLLCYRLYYPGRLGKIFRRKLSNVDE